MCLRGRIRTSLDTGLVSLGTRLVSFSTGLVSFSVIAVFLAGSAQAQTIEALPRTEIGASLQQAGEPPCLPPEQAAAARDAQRPAAETPGFVMPTTGALFTLPPAEAEAAPLPECPPPAAPPVPWAPIRPPAPDIFGYAAVPIGTALRGDWDAERAIELDTRRGLWDELLMDAKSQSGVPLLDMVNLWVNSRLRYLEDRYGDHWSDAQETLRNGYGDCEDYAIVKMALLAKLGVPGNDMFLVVLRDKAQLDHAVLAVRNGGELLVLDNRTDQLRRASEIEDYLPTLSYSGPSAGLMAALRHPGKEPGAARFHRQDSNAEDLKPKDRGADQKPSRNVANLSSASSSVAFCLAKQSLR